MSELVFISVIIVLGIIIVLQILERFHVVDQATQKENKLLEENSRLVKAVIAKNANDYVMTTSIDKVAPETKQSEDSDLVPEESLSDEDFMQAIGKQVKAKKN